MLHHANFGFPIEHVSHLFQAAKDEHFLPVDQLLEAFHSCPGIIRNTESLIEDCRIGFDFNTIKNKNCFTGDRYDDKLLLEKLAGILVLLPDHLGCDTLFHVPRILSRRAGKRGEFCSGLLPENH